MIFKSHAMRHALTVSVAVLLTLFLAHFVSNASPGWMVLTAFLVNYTTRGAVLRQSIFYFFYLTLGAIIVGWLYPELMAWIYDVMLGGVVGIACNQLLLPVRPFVEFSQGLIPVIRAITHFNNEMINLVMGGNGYLALQLDLHEVEKTLHAKHSTYPEWVYEVGFNPGLRAGYRSFLVNVEHIIEIVLSLSYRLTLIKSSEAWHGLSAELSQVVKNNNHLLELLEQYFKTGQFAKTDIDFTSDVALLDTRATECIPGNLELLDVYPDNVTIVMVIRDIKDMRKLLLQLALAVSGK